MTNKANEQCNNSENNSLKNTYDKILTSGEWNYYKDETDSTIKTYDVTIFDDAEKCKKFIENYFKDGGKKIVFEWPDKDNNENIENEEYINRCPHIVSTYLLGLIIAETLGIDKMTEIDYNTDFKYVWFMTCLYHDFGYIYEKGNTIKEEKLNNIANCGIKELENIIGIENDLYDSPYNDPKDNIYSKEQAEIYLKYRAETKSKDNKGKIDHGIVGGLMLFDRLIKNYNEAYNNVSKDNKDIDKNDFDYHGLHFSKSNNKLYAKVSDAIIAHNIWLDTFNDMDEVKQKGIEIKSKINKDNYLGFLLGIADTLEPLKQYKKTSKNTNQLKNDTSTIENSNQSKNNDEITKSTNQLEKYHFKKIENGFELSIDNNNKKNNNDNTDNNNIIDQHKNITFELRKWIDVNVEFNNKNKAIKITLPPTEE